MTMTALLTPTPEVTGLPGGSDIPIIPFRMATLANGLTLIVHEDRRNPLISTQLRFNVGAKDEPPGRTGFAHLFEHLMFKASTNRRGNWHAMLRGMGGTRINGSTGPDRTNYYQTVPKAALDQLLWMESDRMGHLLGGINAEILADEIAVIKNEKRQCEGEPYGLVYETIATTLYPREHPYGHTVIGSFEDIGNADLDAVHDWYGRWYGAANAILVIAGDIGFDEALAKVTHWFGAIPPGTPLRRVTRWLPDVSELRRVVLEDRVPHRRLQGVWVAPPAAETDAALLGVVQKLLTGGSHSRLVRRLVETERSCLRISSGIDASYLSGEFHIAATLMPDADAAAVERAIGEELARLIADGPDQEELDRICRSGRQDMVRRLDDLSHVVDVLSSSMMIHGRPDGYLDHVRAVQAATPADIQAVARRWLSRQALALDVRPFAAQAATDDPAVRSTAPQSGITAAPRFPAVEQATLANGLSIRFARRPGTHTIDISLHMRGGAATDPPGAEGLAALTLSALGRGTARHSKHELSELKDGLGLRHGVDVEHNGATLVMIALKDGAAEAMALLAELLLEPTFPEQEVRLMLDRRIAAARNRTFDPSWSAVDAAAWLIHGTGHVFGRPVDGTAASLSALTREMLVARHRGWLDPARATLVVAGDLTFDRVVAMAEAAFGGWSAIADTVAARAGVGTPAPGRYLIKRPGGAQMALHVAMASPDIRHGDAAFDLFNSLFGGSSQARLNANLRERRGWTYGARSSISVSPDIGSFTITTEVEGARSLEAIDEIAAELRGLTRDRLVTAAELEDARRAALVAMPARWVGNHSVVHAVIEQSMFSLPDDWHDGEEARIRAVTMADIERVAAIVGDPDRYSWIAAGDPGFVAGAANLTVIDHT